METGGWKNSFICRWFFRLMALLGLLVTLGIAAGLFWGEKNKGNVAHIKLKGPIVTEDSKEFFDD